MKSFVLSLLMICLSSTSFAASRVDSVLSNDADTELQKIEQTLNRISDNDAALLRFQKELLLEGKKENKRTAGKVLIGVGAAGLIVGSVMLKRDPNFNQVFQAFALIGGGAVAGASGGVMIYLNKSELEEISTKIDATLKDSAEAKKSLIKQIARYCSIQPQHKLCY